MKTEDQFEEALQVSEDLAKVTALNGYYFNVCRQILNKHGDRLYNEYPENHASIVRYIEQYNGQ